MPENNNLPKQLKDIPLSVLDLAPIIEGGTPSDALENSVDLAQHAEKWGYNRYWVAEHHNMPSIASSATSVVIGHVAGETSTIRVGSGGIMLPNHSPLIIAEQFGTLESLYPGRIDLGLGRAPGTDQRTAQALRGRFGRNAEDFPDQVAELRGYFDPDLGTAPRGVRAFPGEGLDIPIWLLGSSGFSAQMAGELGLPFSFASHFSPNNTLPALELYRRHFKPSNILDEPYAMLGVNVIVAESDEKAEFLASSLQQAFLNLIRNTPTKLQPPVENVDSLMSAYEKAALEQQLGGAVVGSPETVKEKLGKFVADTKADELIVTAQIYNHDDRLRSFELLSELAK
ncbi:LLM class flavin-dependent oxidoreductase [Pseudalkalibacillus caeni]|uniref:LLM class flavin-dependent oxidoreductase n=1 Tax=Exobacillus caeni TaxID=2574798 RepID=A0A5R9EZV2_9BACL|nr:LLM class flavin-dependent oxidoreductase [Pseudalkalibacillus caeni]TLS36767.1 LLM class flavin-dependent oxidoreductase [Pseudalkalibacillus caeni]